MATDIEKQVYKALTVKVGARILIPVIYTRRALRDSSVSASIAWVGKGSAEAQAAQLIAAMQNAEREARQLIEKLTKKAA